MEEKKASLYVITNKINGKKYFGVTSQIPATNRWNGHKTVARRRVRKTPLYQAINKYGIENFDFTVLNSGLSLEYAYGLEMLHICRYDTTNISNGYNLSKGGEINRGHSIPDDVIEKRAKQYLGEGNPFYGKTHTEEVRRKISNANSGRKHTEKTRRKMSESRTGEKHHLFGKTGEEHHMYGFKKTKEQILKSASKHPLRKEVVRVDKDTGEELEVYFSKSKACEWIMSNTDCKSDNLRSVLSTLTGAIKKNNVSYGYKWRIVE